MTATQFTALPHKTRKSCQGGPSDVNGKKPKPYISDGSSIPRCHSLNDVAMGDDYLLLAHRPLPDTQPYAKFGPIFIHSKDCQHFDDLSQV